MGDLHKAELSDPVIQHHMSDLNETLLEQNLLRIVEPFSRVEVSHVAHLIKLPLDRVQSKLSEMILDRKLRGTLDQGQGTLILYEDDAVNGIYSNSIASIKNTQAVLDVLQEGSPREVDLREDPGVG